MTTQRVNSVDFAKALADETRQKIMGLCCCKWLNVGEIVDALDVSQRTAVQEPDSTGFASSRNQIVGVGGGGVSVSGVSVEGIGVSVAGMGVWVGMGVSVGTGVSVGGGAHIWSKGLTGGGAPPPQRHPSTSPLWVLWLLAPTGE